jgi:hypothetical protein
VLWQVQEHSLGAGAPIDLNEAVFAGHEKDHIAVALLIGELGSVTRVSVSGSTAAMCQRLEAVLGGWSFKPTILDGRGHAGPHTVRNYAPRPLQDTMTRRFQAYERPNNLCSSSSRRCGLVRTRPFHLIATEPVTACHRHKSGLPTSKIDE